MHHVSGRMEHRFLNPTSKPFNISIKEEEILAVEDIESDQPKDIVIRTNRSRPTWLDCPYAVGWIHELNGHLKCPSKRTQYRNFKFLEEAIVFGRCGQMPFFVYDRFYRRVCLICY
jgi:hypothetical protein